MTLVCSERFPEKPEGFFLDPALKANLDHLVKAITKDNDFVIIVSGSGQVRVGKSVLAMQIGAYLTEEVNKQEKTNNEFGLNNFVFRGAHLIEKAKDMPKYSVIIYDEAGSDLMGRKVMHQSTQAVLDFFREAGQLNLFLILVIPDFFDLPKGIAITRSTLLLDVDYREKFTRGLFRLYGKRQKKLLYLIGKRFLDYDASKPDYPHGSFTNFYPVDKMKYQELKLAALTGRSVEDLQKKEKQNLKYTHQRNILIRHIYKNYGMTQKEIGDLIGIAADAISRVCSDYND